MDKLSDSMKSVQGESMSFFNYVFNFDDENKSHIMNMLQYTLLTIIPVLIVLRGIKHIVPEDDDSKGSLEILFESFGQVIVIMLSIWFINKVIRFIPTYSGESYSKFNEVNFIIPFILILATMQTKLGAKFNILIDRVMFAITGRKEGYEDEDKKGKGQGQNGGAVRVSQPGLGMPQHQPSQADMLTNILPTGGNPQLTAMPPQYMQQQPTQDYSGMYQQQATPLVGANEPMAANEMGGGWSSW
jgi:hypothetical protein